MCNSGMRKSAQQGISLVELIMFIVIISAGLAGILGVINLVTGHSADALVQKQAQAIAESMLEEVELQNFSKPAGGFAGPYTPANRSQFDTVTDYNGFATNGIFSPDNNAIAGLGNYNLNVAVVNSAFGTVPAASAVLITVTVNGPNGIIAVAEGYRGSAL